MASDPYRTDGPYGRPATRTSTSDAQNSLVDLEFAGNGGSAGLAGAIDLGVLPRDGFDDDLATEQRYGSARVRRPSPRLWLAGYAVVLLALFGGAAPAAPPVVDAAWAVPMHGVGSDQYGSLATSADTLFLLTWPSDAVVTAYELPGGPFRPTGDPGRPRWRTSLPREVEALRLLPSGVLLATTTSGGARDPAVVALDTATGRVLWRHDDAEVAPTGAGRWLMEQAPAIGATVLRLTDARTGQTRWSTPLAGQAQIVSPSGYGITAAPTWVAIEQVDGRTRVLDLATGRTLADKVPWAAPAGVVDGTVDGSADRTSMEGIGDALLRVSLGASGFVVTDYAAATLTERWRRELPGPVMGVTPCAPLLCVEAEQLYGLDPASGAIRWTQPGWRRSVPFGDWLLAINNDRGALREALLDPRTGRQVLDLGHWAMVDYPRPGVPIYTIWTGTSPQARWLGVLSPQSMAVRALGPLSGQAQSCVGAPSWFACGDNNRVQVWHIDATGTGTPR